MTPSTPLSTTACTAPYRRRDLRDRAAQPVARDRPVRLRRARRRCSKVRRLGEDWLLFRQSDGTLRMLADRCPHRGAPLSLGQHLGDRVACQYHGVQVDGDGTVSLGARACPAATSRASRLVAQPAGAGGRRARSSPTSATTEHPEPATLDAARSGSPTTASRRFLCYAEWKAPWRFAMENLLDPMHGAFLHRESHSMFGGETYARSSGSARPTAASSSRRPTSAA